MSFLKFWSKSSKAKDNNSHKIEKIYDRDADENITLPPAFDRRERNQLSISRSGRYKQKKRQRSALVDNPHLSSSDLGQENSNPEESVIVHNYDNGISIEKLPRAKITDYDRIQSRYRSPDTVYPERIHFSDHRPTHFPEQLHFSIERERTNAQVGRATVL